MHFTTIDDLLADAGLAAPTPWLLALSLDDYDTNVPVADLLSGRAMVATHYEGEPLAPEHGGPWHASLVRAGTIATIPAGGREPTDELKTRGYEETLCSGAGFWGVPGQ